MTYTGMAYTVIACIVMALLQRFQQQRMLVELRPQTTARLDLDRAVQLPDPLM